YPIVQVAPELGPQAPMEWPPPMDPRVRRWRDRVAGHGNAGNQIYLHVPFCPFICHFCPLFKMRLGNAEAVDQKAAFVDSLVAEIELYGRKPDVASTRFDAIYFGGGTSTELSPTQ